MITASIYTLVVVPVVILALSVGAVLWSNASTRRFDKFEAQSRVDALTTSIGLDSDSVSSGEDDFALGAGLSKSVLDRPLFSTSLTGGLGMSTPVSPVADQVRAASTSPDPKRTAEGA